MAGDALNNVYGVNTHGNYGAPGYTGALGAFTGYAPWEVDADEQFTTLYAEATAGCMFHGTDRDTNESCQFADALSAWRQQNEELYCSFHRAECDSRVAHTILGLAGMVPVLGIGFNGVDAILYISEGDYLGAGIAIGSSVPLAGALGKVGRIGRGAVGDAAKVFNGLPESGFKFLDDAPSPGSFCSFTPQTTVVTPGGDVPIGELEAGDEVIARDESTGETSTREVTAVLVHADAVTGTVVIDGEVIETTPEHPFFTLDRGFVRAAELRPGDLVATEDGTPGTVGSVTWDGGPAVMYNLSVAVDHTFFVGEGGWWVHNACGVHGNSLSSTNPQHLYEIIVTNSAGVTGTYKFGISGGKVAASGLSYRATAQVNRLNKYALLMGTGETFTSVIRKTATNRLDIVAEELSATRAFELLHGYRPPGMKLP